MDKETAERLAKLETQMHDIREDKAAWNTLIRDIIKRVILWIMAMLTAGAIFGWNLPDNVRKALSEWISK